MRFTVQNLRTSCRYRNNADPPLVIHVPLRDIHTYHLGRDWILEAAAFSSVSSEDSGLRSDRIRQVKAMKDRACRLQFGGSAFH